MTAEQFNQHGWKATDKVVSKGDVFEVRGVDFKNGKIEIYHSSIFGISPLQGFCDYKEFELYQPIHEAHAHLLTNPD